MSASPSLIRQDRDILTVPFSEIFEEWEWRTNHYRDRTMVRALAMWDRYFLLVQLMKRHDMLHPWLYARCREVEQEPDGFLDLWAREHYKSTIITFAGSIQETLKDPEITIGIFSHTATIARGFVRQIKNELEMNEQLQQLFPDVLWADPQKDSPQWSIEGGLVVKRKTNPKEATIEGHGLVDGMPTGKHFKLMVPDDVVTRDSVTSPEMVQKTTECWELSDNLGSQGGRKWHVGTRYSYADTYQVMIERGAVIPRLRTATDDGTITGKPVLLPQEEWDRKVRDQGEATISCQMLQNPLAGHQRMFDVGDLRIYEVRPETLAVYIMVDPARSKKKNSANTAMVVLGLDVAGNKFLLDGFDHKMDLMERWQRMAQLRARWSRAIGVTLVKVGYESFGAQADLDYFQEQMRLTRTVFDIIELAWPRDGSGAKVDRVQRLGPDLRGHKLFLPYETDETRLTTQQRKMLGGYEYRIAQPIKRKDENNKIYDLAERLRLQVHYFPFAQRVDLIDAASRVYDMEPRAPAKGEPQYAEPTFT